jgi:hypothetical protein
MGNEAPHIQDGIIELLQRWGNEPWLLDAQQVKDDAGLRLEVRVVDGLYKEDVLPRRLIVSRDWDNPSTCYLIVRRVPDPLVAAEARKTLLQLGPLTNTPAV